MRTWSSPAACEVDARLCAAYREARRLGLQVLATGDRLGQRFSRSASTLFSPRLVNFFGALGGIGKDEHLVTRHLQKPAADSHRFLAATTFDAHDARLQRGQQRRVPRQDADHSLRTRRDDHVRGLFCENLTFGGDDLNA